MNPASVPDIHDISLPLDPGMWPLANGWWLLLTLVVALTALVISNVVRHFSFWRMRRLALKQLPLCDNLDQINRLLKVLCLHYLTDSSEHQDISSMHGSAWAEFLNAILPQQQASQNIAVQQAIYQADSHQHLPVYRDIAMAWIGQLNRRAIKQYANTTVINKSSYNV